MDFERREAGASLGLLGVGTRMRRTRSLQAIRGLIGASCLAFAASAAYADSLLNLPSDRPGAYRAGRDPGEWHHHLAREVIGAAFSDRVSLGAEFEVEKRPTSVMGLPETALKSYQLRATLQVVPFPRSLSPYAGVGVGIGATRFDESAIDMARTPLGADSFSVGIGGVGYVGLRLPLGDHISVFGEGRAAVATQLADDVVLGGDGRTALTGLAGLRMRF